MLIVQVHVHVIPAFVESFKQFTMENAQNSVHEPGIARFDILQSQEDPTRFLLVEVYRDEEAPARHKETAHYNRWRDAVAGMMQEPRTSDKYTNIFPDEHGWSWLKNNDVI